jgi:hypothetical protein
MAPAVDRAVTQAGVNAGSTELQHPSAIVALMHELNSIPGRESVKPRRQELQPETDRYRSARTTMNEQSDGQAVTAQQASAAASATLFGSLFAARSSLLVLELRGLLMLGLGLLVPLLLAVAVTAADRNGARRSSENRSGRGRTTTRTKVGAR